MQKARLDEAQAGIKVARRNINNLRYAEDTTLMAESKEVKSLLLKVKEESGKVLELVERYWRTFPPVGSRVVYVQMMKASVLTN